jgi:cellulose biosynthesis protein BcsQ
MKIIGIYNIKGGVGKTATAVNLGYISSQAGLRTLVWDLDPQGAASFYFRIKPRLKGQKKLLRGKGDLDSAIKATDYPGLDLLPADFGLRNLDLLFEECKHPTLQLLALLKPLSENYDRIYLDCPPSISLLSENVFRAVTALVVPTIPTVLSLRTLAQIQAFLEEHKLERLPVWPLLSMVDRRKRMHLEVLAKPPEHSFSNSIPYNSAVELMGEHRQPLLLYAKNSQPANAYESLWQELELRLSETGKKQKDKK